ncbi:nematode fatty acid retinoid binding protein [Dictyocaulus viviparus]|uniref:Fatty-acid and retinol-binding protein 1 n=1 Tax=Dictyocaulus viviparus TaxID=29172 RepID=A0A0D8XP70_DICVI|nr:nematode fatty acid retinoid binding protein [Dictyocaulus viviparus]
MIRQTVIIAAFLCIVYAAPFESIEDIPAEYREMMPKEAKEFLTGLSEDDKKVLKDIAKNYATYKNEDEKCYRFLNSFCFKVLAALKEKSPELGAKAEKLHIMVKEKVESLGDEAKAFAKEVLCFVKMIKGARKIQASVVAGNKPNLAELKEKAQTAINKYKALSDGAKEDLQKHFPILTSFFKSEKFQKMAESLMTKN